MCPGVADCNSFGKKDGIAIERTKVDAGCDVEVRMVGNVRAEDEGGSPI